MNKLSVALATFNEEKNISSCLAAVKEIADEIVIVDGSSTDGTVALASEFGARVSIVPNQQIFHINKQKALGMASSPWILQLDADEIVSKKLAHEIKKVIALSDEEIEAYQESLPHKALFFRHQKLLEERDGMIGQNSEEYVAFFIPRLNYFLGRNLRYGGVYPDGVIRLVKKGKAHFPCIDVHEQMVVDGRVGWLHENLLHMADPTFKRYIDRNNRYINLLTKQLKKDGVGRDPLTFAKYLFALPLWWFSLTYFRHKGFLDSWQGFVFSFFSALRFPRAYVRYLRYPG